VKNEACEEVKTMGWKNVFKPQATKEFKKMSPKMGAHFFLIFKIV
jgi:hypothetical protein